MISEKERQQIDLISHKISGNQASPEDYEQFEAILLKAGFSHEDVTARLRQNGFFDYAAYIKARQEAHTYDTKRALEVFIAGGLMGLGLAVRIAFAAKKLREPSVPPSLEYKKEQKRTAAHAQSAIPT